MIVSSTCCWDAPLSCEDCSAAGPRLEQVRLDLLPMAFLKDDVDLHHVSPRISILVDHATVSPQDISQFDGVPLHFMMCRPQGGGQAAFHAFTTREGLGQQLLECTLGVPTASVREAPLQATNGIIFNDSEWWGEASYFLAAGQSINLTDTWWNKRMSSLRGGGVGTLVTLFENADFSGSTLTLTTDLAWPDLGVFGWNNRASAVVVWQVPMSSHKLPAKADSDK